MKFVYVNSSPRVKLKKILGSLIHHRSVSFLFVHNYSSSLTALLLLRKLANLSLLMSLKHAWCHSCAYKDVIPILCGEVYTHTIN